MEGATFYGNDEVLDDAFHRALKLNYGDVISGNQIWPVFGRFATRTYGSGSDSYPWTWGFWVDVQNKYAGLRVMFAGQYHYGWARFDMQLGNQYGVQNLITLKDYAYNSQPNQQILAGQMPSCTDNYEPNNSKQQATQIQSNQEYQALINTTLDVDWFKFDVLASEPNIRIRLFNLPKNYNLFLYNPAGTKIGFSKHTGTHPDTIVANGLLAGTYSVKVRNKAGQFDPSNCYSLKVESSNSPWKLSSLKDDNSEAQFDLFPNPASNQLAIQCDDENIQSADVTIYNLLGDQLRIIKNLSLQNSQSTIDVSELPPGGYLIRIYFEVGVEVKKFIVTR